MEAFNYGTPALADEHEFQEVFRFLYHEQIQGLFGEDAMVLAAVEAYPDFLTKGFSEPDVLIAFGHPERGLGIYAGQSMKQDGLSLTSCIDHTSAPQEIWRFCEKSAPRILSDLEDFRVEFAPDSALIAPYLVRPVDPAPKKSYKSLLSTWKETHHASTLLYSKPFSSGERPDSLADFRNSYYVAALAIYFRSKRPLPNFSLDWLEVFHLSFQMAWGSPTLGKLREDMEVGEQKRLLLEHQTRRDAELRTLADEVSRKIEEHTEVIRTETDKLITAIAPPTERGFDSSDAAAIFHHDKPIDKVLPLIGVHDPGRKLEYNNELPNPVLIRGLINFALLHMFGSKAEREAALTSYADLNEKASAVVAHNLKSKTLKALVDLISAGDHSAFLLLKELNYSPNLAGRAASFFSLAARLMLGEVTQEFSVRIVTPDPRQKTIELTSHTFVTKAFEKVSAFGSESYLFQYPFFPSLTAMPHKKWFAPFAEMLGHHLQKSQRGSVFVSHVDISTVKNHSEISCVLGETDQGAVERVFSLLKDAESAGAGGHDMRMCWIRLTKCCAHELDFDNRQIHFWIGR
jgi:hypothetical protein